MTDKEFSKYGKCPHCFSEHLATTLRGSINQKDPSDNRYTCQSCKRSGRIADIPSEPMTAQEYARFCNLEKQ